MMKEKRRDPRFETKEKVWCEGQELRGPAQATNMSRGGMAIVSDDPAKVGTQLKVSFVAPDQGDVSVNMEVVWRDKKPRNGQVAMGLRVVDFEKGQDAFNRFVTSHMSDSNPEEKSETDDRAGSDDESGKKL